MPSALIVAGVVRLEVSCLARLSALASSLPMARPERRETIAPPLATLSERPSRRPQVAAAAGSMEPALDVLGRGLHLRHLPLSRVGGTFGPVARGQFPVRRGLGFPQDNRLKNRRDRRAPFRAYKEDTVRLGLLFGTSKPLAKVPLHRERGGDDLIDGIRGGAYYRFSKVTVGPDQDRCRGR